MKKIKLLILIVILILFLGCPVKDDDVFVTINVVDELGNVVVGANVDVYRNYSLKKEEYDLVDIEGENIGSKKTDEKGETIFIIPKGQYAFKAYKEDKKGIEEKLLTEVNNHIKLILKNKKEKRHFIKEREIFFYVKEKKEVDDSRYLIDIRMIKITGSNNKYYFVPDLISDPKESIFEVDSLGTKLIVYGEQRGYSAKIRLNGQKLELYDILKISSPFVNTFYHYAYEFEVNSEKHPWNHIKDAEKINFDFKVCPESEYINLSDIPDLEFQPERDKKIRVITCTSEINPVEFNAKYAKGKIDIAIPIFYSSERPQEFLLKFFKNEEFQEKKPNIEYSAEFIEEWFNKEAFEYGIQDFNLNINYYGPYKIDRLDFDKLYKYDKQYIQDTVIKEFYRLNPSAKDDVIIPFYFEKDFITREFADRENKTSLINYYYQDDCIKCLAEKSLSDCIKNFTACTLVNLNNVKGFELEHCPTKIYPTRSYNLFEVIPEDWHKCWVFEWEYIIANSVRIATHELGHIFGANDKYVGFACTVPPINDKYSDLMCGKVYNFNFGSWSPVNLDRIKIGVHTAKEMGWVDLDGDGIKEVYDECPWNKENNC